MSPGKARRHGARQKNREKFYGRISDDHDAFGAAVGIWLQSGQQRDSSCLVGKTGVLAKVPPEISGGAQLREDQSKGMLSR
jgi:hypothetical protein